MIKWRFFLLFVAAETVVGQNYAPAATSPSGTATSPGGGSPPGTVTSPGAGATSTGPAPPGTCPANQASCQNAKVQSLEQYREDDTAAGSILATNQGVPIADDTNSLKAGVRGPTLLEGFILREKITHFDHERIPERVVHARGAAAHGIFQPYASWANITRASFLQDPSKTTPVFVRFSTVGGNRGSADTVRDIRGFATKFYTDQGNFDIVGNNAPVFFVQDAIQFPDFVHSVKPEPQNEIPQSSSAHDTFYDFVSQQTESLHAVLWLLSDRALPRSYSMMEGFGVHTFRFVTAQGVSRFVKFHWKPVLGIRSLTFDEVTKIAGKDPDFNRRQLWEDIEAGNYPQFELGVQIVEEADQFKFSFDLLDPTKLIPEEQVPVIKLGMMTLNRNPDNYFAETEQVAFDIGNVVSGIDFTDDPLMQGRIFSYLDTQLSRLGGVNFNEIPINRPICPFKNNQRDGFHRQTINVAKTAYDVNTINNGLPAQAGSTIGFTSYPEAVSGTKIRVRSDTFADHYSQATLFYQSGSLAEQDHIVSAFTFELSKLTYPILQTRMLNILQNIDGTLASKVASNLNMVLPAKDNNGYPKQVTPSPALSIANHGVNNIKSFKIAILVDNGVNGDTVAAMKAGLIAAGASVKIIAPKIGNVTVGQGQAVAADGSIDANPSVLFDAAFIAGGTAAESTSLQDYGKANSFAYETYAYYKALAASGSAVTFLTSIGLIPAAGSGLNMPDGVTTTSGDGLSNDFINQFIANAAKYRFYNRQDVNMVPV